MGQSGTESHRDVAAKKANPANAHPMPKDSDVTDPSVVVIGPATWNHIIALDELPRAQPHMQFANDHWWTVGGTSAGKALHLADLRIHTPSSPHSARTRRPIT